MDRFVLLMLLIAVILSNKQDVPPPPEENITDTGSPALQRPDSVFAVRSVYSNLTRNGTAVSLGHGLLVTAAHVVEGHKRPELEINGQWQTLGVSIVSGADVAYLTSRDASLPVTKVRKPEYGEKATAYGLRTQQVQSGIVSNDGTLSLSASEPGVNFGDSGGAVFGDDGCLIGIISSKNPGNSRVVYFEALNPPTPFSQAKQAAKQPNNTVTSPACAGGACNVRVKGRWWK